MELQRVNPGQAGAIGVPVRVPNSNAGVIASAAADSVARRAQGVNAIHGAVGKANNALAGFTRMKVEEHSSEARYQQKVMEANFATDMQLTANLFGTKLDAVSAKMRQYYDLDDAQFLQAVEREMGNELSKTVSEAEKPLGKDNVNGIGFRNAGFFKERIKTTLRGRLGAAFVAEQVRKRAEYQTKTAIGKAETNLENLAKQGNTDMARYAEMAEAQLSPYLTPTEIANVTEATWKQGVSTSYNMMTQDIGAYALDVFATKFNKRRESGLDFGLALREAEKAASEVWASQFEAVYKDEIIRGVISEGDFKKTEESFYAALRKASEGAKETTKRQIVSELQASVAGAFVPTAPEVTPVYQAYSGRNISDFKDPGAEASRILGGGATQVLALSGEQHSELRVMLSNDLAMLDLSDKKDLGKAVEILNTARVLPVTMHEQLRGQFQSMVANVGNKSDAIARDQVKDAIIELGVKDKNDISRLTGVLLRAAKSNPAQFDAIAADIVSEYRARQAANDESEALAGGIFGTYFDYSTGVDFAKMMLSERKPVIEPTPVVETGKGKPASTDTSVPVGVTTIPAPQKKTEKKAEPKKESIELPYPTTRPAVDEDAATERGRKILEERQNF